MAGCLSIQWVSVGPDDSRLSADDLDGVMAHPVVRWIASPATRREHFRYIHMAESICEVLSAALTVPASTRRGSGQTRLGRRRHHAATSCSEALSPYVWLSFSLVCRSPACTCTLRCGAPGPPLPSVFRSLCPCTPASWSEAVLNEIIFPQIQRSLLSGSGSHRDIGEPLFSFLIFLLFISYLLLRSSIELPIIRRALSL